MADTSDDEPISKRRRLQPTPTAERYDAIVRHRMKKQPSFSHHDQNTNEERETAPTAERHDSERHRLKKESMFPHQADGTQAYPTTEKACERPLLLPNERDVSEPADEYLHQTSLRRSFTTGALLNSQNNRESRMTITAKWSSSRPHVS